ncbi:MAG: hypothetical protein KAQ89_05470 [Planctomycetes bacterium]|nr:hypothetical protein [Planctomycetota bacterium]
MIRLFVFKFMVFVLPCLLFIGCDSNGANEPVWEQVKLADLAPSNVAGDPESQRLKTINFNIYIFETPVESTGKLNAVWPILYTKPLRFNDKSAFNANSFLAGFGDAQMWNPVADLLRTAGCKKIEKISLLLLDGNANDVSITLLRDEQEIFYVPQSGVMEGVSTGSGKLAWRIKAKKKSGSRGVCKVEAEPVFLPPRQKPIPQLAAQEEAGEYVFSSAGFGLEMTPGDFVFVGPEKYINHRITLAGIFFGQPQQKPAIRTYLLVCTAINE